MKIREMLFKRFVAHATNKIGTVVQNTGTSLDGGTAVKLDNHVRVVYSKEIEFKAQPTMRFLQFAKVKTELGVEPGLTIQMMTYNNLKKGGALQEGVRITTQALSSTMKEIRVQEYGNAVSVSELSLRSSFRDIMADATTLLARDYALTVDCLLRDTALSVPNVIYGRKDGANKISARKDITANNPLSVATIKDAIEILATNNTPKFEGNYYIAFVHPHQSRLLRDDPRWLDVAKYATPENMLTGEIGKIDDVRFIETTLMPNGAAPSDDPAFKNELKAGVGGNQVDVYQAVVFGQDLYGFAVSLPVELRDNGVVDFGRERGLAWYAIMGAGILHPERGVVIETC